MGVQPNGLGRTNNCLRGAVNHAGESVLATSDKPFVLTFDFRVEHVAHRYAQATVTRCSAYAEQITSLPVQQCQARWPQHSEVKREQPPVGESKVVAGYQPPAASLQCVVRNEGGAGRSPAEPAQEETITLVHGCLGNESFGKSQQPFDKTRH